VDGNCGRGIYGALNELVKPICKALESRKVHFPEGLIWIQLHEYKFIYAIFKYHAEVDIIKGDETMGEPKIVSFHSFKGGTGRSVGLANIAYALAKSGSNVGCIDCDIEAPAFKVVFDIQASASGKRYMDFYDLFLKDIERSRKVLEVFNAGIAMGLSGGNLYVIPGYLGPGWAEWRDETVEMLNRLRQRGDEEIKGEILETFRDFCREFELDYIFLDLRAGLSEEIAGPFITASDIIVNFLRADKQSLHHAPTVMEAIAKYNNHQIAIINSVPLGDVARARIEQLKSEINRLSLDIQVFELPYTPSLAVDERIIDSPREGEEEILKIYKKIADHIKNP